MTHHLSVMSSSAGFSVHGLSAGAPPRHGKTLAFTAGFLASSPKCGRLVVVVAAGAAAPGGSDDSPLYREAVVSEFRLGMQTFKISHRPMAFVPTPTNPLPDLDVVFNTARNCTPMLEFLLTKEDVHPNVVKELIRAGHTFLILEGQAKEGYVRADALVNGIEGMKLVCRTFFKDDKRTAKSAAPNVPHSADADYREVFFKDLADLFYLYYQFVEAQAKARYGGTM